MQPPDDPAMPPAALGPAAAGAGSDAVVDAEAVLGGSLQALQFAPGFAGAVQVQLHQQQV